MNRSAYDYIGVLSPALCKSIGAPGVAAHIDDTLVVVCQIRGSPQPDEANSIAFVCAPRFARVQPDFFEFVMAETCGKNCDVVSPIHQSLGQIELRCKLLIRSGRVLREPPDVELAVAEFTFGVA